jgi:hypothetical protein
MRSVRWGIDRFSKSCFAFVIIKHTTSLLIVYSFHQEDGDIYAMGDRPPLTIIACFFFPTKHSLFILS